MRKAFLARPPGHPGVAIGGERGLCGGAVGSVGPAMRKGEKASTAGDGVRGEEWGVGGGLCVGDVAGRSAPRGEGEIREEPRQGNASAVGGCSSVGGAEGFGGYSGPARSPKSLVFVLKARPNAPNCTR